MVKTVMVYNDFDPIPDRVLDRMCDNGFGAPKTMCARMHGLALQPPKDMLAPKKTKE